MVSAIFYLALLVILHWAGSIGEVRENFASEMSNIDEFNKNMALLRQGTVAAVDGLKVPGKLVVLGTVEANNLVTYEDKILKVNGNPLNEIKGNIHFKERVYVRGDTEVNSLICNGRTSMSGDTVFNKKVVFNRGVSGVGTNFNGYVFLNKSTGCDTAAQLKKRKQQGLAFHTTLVMGGKNKDKKLYWYFTDSSDKINRLTNSNLNILFTNTNVCLGGELVVNK